MVIDATRTLRGAFAGAAAAAVWAAQQPLDQRVFRVRYDDTELLGKWVTRRPRWRAVGVAMHVQNGALFGALYANVAPALPLPAWARGPALGLLEHVATWPGTRLLERVHPAGAELPRLWGSRRAFAQGAWRHALFGAVLGELERRLNERSAAPTPVSQAVAETDGHGSAQHLAAAAGG
jgi:hypothetical protein